MTFRDLSYWGIFKLTLIFEFLVSILITPFMFLLYAVKPDAFTFNIDNPIKVAGISAHYSDAAGMTFAFVMGFMISLIGLMVKCAVLYLLAQKTPLGRIKIGKAAPQTV